MQIAYKKNISDEELLSLYLKTNNLKVLGKLFMQYYHLVYGVCLKYLKEREESKDATVQIFEKLILEIPKHKIEKFKPWLYVLTKNYCLMHLRKKTSEEKKFKLFSDEKIMENTEDLHPINEAPNLEIENKLRACLERLKIEQKECIVMFYYQQKCYKEIASLQGIEEKKVKSFIQNGKRNLKNCLEQNEKE